MIESTILANLVYSEEYTRKVLPFLKAEYFNSPVDQLIFNLICEYTVKYNANPTREALQIELSDRDNVPEMVHAETQTKIDELKLDDSAPQLQWLLDKTEEFCQKRAIFNAIARSIAIHNGETKESEGAIPTILAEALAVSFDTHIGHDYIEDSDDRFEYYHKKEDRIAFDVAILNKATDGGILKKTLNVLMAGTGVGKSLIMCHFAASYLLAGLNVLYITLEMAEERIAERIDANLLDTPIAELRLLPKEIYDKKIARIKGKTTGKLIIKEYPTASAGAGHFRHLVNELRLKKNFSADVIFIDYINICVSSRIKAGANVNSYTMVKSIAEEIRGLAIELNVPIWTATQTNREGFGNSDPGLENTSESFGLPMTVDFMLSAYRDEELDRLGQIRMKQLKSRYADKSNLLHFMVGVDRSKMRLYETEQSAQDDVSQGGSEPFITDEMEQESIFDRGTFGGRMDAEKKKGLKKIFI